MIQVLGAGIAGTAVARALALRGRRDVCVFDPEAEPGSTVLALGGFRTQHGSALNIELALRSRPYFEERAERIRFRPNGYLYFAVEEEGARLLRERADLQRAAGLPVGPPPRGVVPPAVRWDGVLEANYCPLDGVYLPPLVLGSMREEAEAAGVSFRRGEAAPDRVPGDVVVIAAGIWSERVGAAYGCALPVRALWRRVYRTGPAGLLPETCPMVLEVPSGYHFRERDGHVHLMGPGRQDDWRHFRDWLRQRVPKARAGAPLDAWDGAYEMTFDQHPFAGPTGAEGVWASCGYSGHGLMHAPAVAECLAAMICGDTPPVDISALDPRRKEPLSDLTQL